MASRPACLTMSAVTQRQALAAESTAIANGWTEEQLLLLAGSQLARSIHQSFPKPGTAHAYLGKGHNAADALIALKILRDAYGWQVGFRTSFPSNDCAPLMQQHLRSLGLGHALATPPTEFPPRGPWLLIDALIGTGSNRPLSAPLREFADEMNGLKATLGARIAAVDLPSGVDPDSGRACDGAVHADITFMIGNAKIGLLKGHAANHTGALALVPVAPLTQVESSDIELIAPQSMTFAKSPRPFDFHKGKAGHVSIIAGSSAYPGAAVMAAHGAMRAGAGLVTLHVPDAIHATVSAKCLPEVIIRSYSQLAEIDDTRAHARVVGCGLGIPTPSDIDALWRLLKHSSTPTVLDADALNLIARHQRLDLLRDTHVITPHPGEFARLAADCALMPREDAARTFSNQFPAVLLLKGARTIVTQQGAPLWCNATGNPGMATAGQGDLLAGVIGAKLATGALPLEAAAHGAWLCGHAAEIALNTEPNLSEESLLPSDVANHLGAAHANWRSATR